MKKDHILFFSISIFIIFLDQLTKFFISNIPLNSKTKVIENFFYISHIQNTGSAFGILQNFNSLLIWITIFIIGIILYYYDEIIKDKKELIAFALIIGGAVGNLIDRIFQGSVTDFLDFYFFTYNYPSFNIADSSVFIGAVVLIWYYLRKK